MTLQEIFTIGFWLGAGIALGTGATVIIGALFFIIGLSIADIAIWLRNVILKIRKKQ